MSRTLRVCLVCGASISSPQWNNRKPENKVLLCSTHLRSRNMRYVGKLNRRYIV